MKQCLLFAALAVAFCGRCEVVTIVENGCSGWTIVHGSAERDKLAASELQEIFEKATGVRLLIKSRGEVKEKDAKGLFLVGSVFAEKKLADEQTWVTAHDGNVILSGGGIAGTCYAVYDFCEKYFGYRLYGTYSGAEIVRKVADLAWDGQDISSTPAFTGYRISHNVPKARNEAEARFFRRNRNNAGDKPISDRILGAQHGLYLWVPAHAGDGFGSSWLPNLVGTRWDPMYEKHPEYFSLDRAGRRTDRGQLCFANRDLRKLLIGRFREFAVKKGPGVYMVGSNDSHNERYCWCEDCARMMAGYRTNGGPLWDFILELCDSVRDLPGVFVASLAYKGPEQTEMAPTGVVFPDNFVADLGFLNGDRPPSRMKDIRLSDGRVYNRLKSIRDWNAVARHVAWWYYGGAAPIQTYRRMQMELKEIAAEGVDSVGSCGTGGDFEFGDVGTYMFFQLAHNPEMNADEAVMDIFHHKYGAAAAKVFGYLKELEQYNIDNWCNPRWGFGCDDTYERIPLDGKDLVRWQRYFEEALESVKDNPLYLANVRIARVGLDCWSIVYAARIRQADPAYALNVNDVLSRAFRACDEAERRGMVDATRNVARRSLNSMRYYANLKSDALPVELSGENAERVRLYLPEDPPHYFAKQAPLTNDTLAAAGVAMFAQGISRTNSISVQLWDAADRTWLLRDSRISEREIREDRYSVLSVGTARLPRDGMFVLADKWGTSLDMRTLGRFYDPSYHEKQYEFFVSVRKEGEGLLCDRVYLVDRGMPGEKPEYMSTVMFAGEIGEASGWKCVLSEEGKDVYIPFEGHYKSKGGRMESPRFKLDGEIGRNCFYRLTFSAKCPVDGYWWVDFFDKDGKQLPDVNSRLYASDDWRSYDVIVPAHPDAVFAQVAFVTSKGARAKDVAFRRATEAETMKWCNDLAATLSRCDPPETAGAWSKLQKTKEEILSGRPVNVVFLGDSIVNDTWCGNAVALIKDALPQSDLRCFLSVRGSTGCWFYREKKNFDEYVAKYNPNLVLIGGISNYLGPNKHTLKEAEDDMVETIERCKAIGAEVVVCTPPPSYEFRIDVAARPFDRSLLNEVGGMQCLQQEYERRAAVRTGVPIWDLTTAPCEAIARSGKPLDWFKRDAAHNDDRGKQLIAQTLAAYFRAAKR